MRALERMCVMILYSECRQGIQYGKYNSKNSHAVPVHRVSGNHPVVLLRVGRIKNVMRRCIIVAGFLLARQKYHN